MEAGGDPPASIPTVSVGWDELSKEEQLVLKRMNRGPYAALSREMIERLLRLGLVQERGQGIGISRAGRELVINALLEARQGDDGPS